MGGNSRDKSCGDLRDDSCGDKKQDLVGFMLLQMWDEQKQGVEDRKIREEERIDRAEDRQAMMQMIGTVVSRYFGIEERKRNIMKTMMRKKYRNRRHKELPVVRHAATVAVVCLQILEAMEECTMGKRKCDGEYDGNNNWDSVEYGAAGQ